MVRVRIPSALLTLCVSVVLTAIKHALAFGALGALLTLVRDFVQVVAIVAHTDGIIGVCARGLHAEKTSASGTGLTLLRVTEVL